MLKIKVWIAIFASMVFVSGVFAAELADKDTDKDGKLSVEEFAGDDKKLKKSFKKLDKDKDKFLSEEEFKASMKEGKKKKGEKGKKKKKKDEAK